MLFPILADMSGCTPWTFHGDRSNSYFNYATPNVLTACSSREALNLTAKVQESDQKSFTGLDVVAVFAKPFRPLKLAAQIREVLGWN